MSSGAAGGADLMGHQGSHCANRDCKQLDFLPFQCRHCKKVYCLEHRVCPCSAAAQDSVCVCPLCAQAIIIRPGEDADVVFDRHTRSSECDPANYDRVHRKPRCPAPGCKQKLVSTNTYTCRECALTVCLRHRLPADHKCAGKAAVAATAAQSRMQLPAGLRRMFGGGGGGGGGAAGSGGGANAQRQQAANGSGGGKSARPAAPPTAASRQQQQRSIDSQLEQYRQQQQYRQRGGQPPAPPRGGGDVIDLTGDAPGPATAAAAASPERCPHCGARFATVEQLLRHAEEAHAGGWSSGQLDMRGGGGGGSGGPERCPHCPQSFGDVVQLVAHVERQHGAGAAGAAAGQGGTAAASCVLS